VGGYGELSPWKRILVIAAGPCAGFAFVAVLTAVDGRPWGECMDWLKDKLKMDIFDKFKCEWFLIDWVKKDWRVRDLMAGINDPDSQYPYYHLVVLLLFSINLFVNILNLLPIIPMDGGMIFKEVCCLLAPRAGLKFAFGFSFLLAAGCTAYLIAVVLQQHGFLKLETKLWYPFAFPEFSLLIFGSLAFQSMQAYRQLAQMERYGDYMQDDDMSGPRHPSDGVVEVEPKDPRDFAPRAPGSERPRY
jgi:hypothetical protein